MKRTKKSRALPPEMKNHWLRGMLKQVRKGADVEQLLLEHGYVLFPALAKLMLRILKERGFDWILCDDYLAPIRDLLNSKSVLLSRLSAKKLGKVRGKRATVPIMWNRNKPTKKRKVTR